VLTGGLTDAVFITPGHEFTAEFTHLCSPVSPPPTAGLRFLTRSPSWSAVRMDEPLYTGEGRSTAWGLPVPDSFHSHANPVFP
jgi:hypothetical protein